MQFQDKLLTTLGLVIVIGFGYSMDMPQALENPLREEPYSLSSLEINLIYISTYLPVMFTDIPLGVILDKFPMQKTVLIIAITSFLSELAIALLFDFRPDGYLYGVYAMRAINGMAGSSAFTMQGFIMARYAAQHYETMMGFGLSLPYIFDAICVTLSPYLFESTQSISLPWYVASFVDFFAVISAIIIAVIITRKQRRIKNQSLLRSSEGEEAEQEVQQQFKASYLLQLPKLFWLIILSMLICEVTMCIFTNLNDLIINRFSIDYVTTGYLLMIPYFAGSAIALIFGRLLTQKPTIRRGICLFSCVFATIGIAALYFLPNNSNASEVSALDFIVIVAFLLFLSLLAGSMYTVLASSVSLLADKKRLGTAWGVIGTAIGLGQSISPLLNGLIEKEDDLTESYTNLTLIYLLISILSVAMTLWLFIGPFSQIDTNFHQSKTRDEEQQQRKLRATIATQNQDPQN